MRKSTTDRMNDYDAVVMGVLEPILVLSATAAIVVVLDGAITYEAPCKRAVRELYRNGVVASCRDIGRAIQNLSPVELPPRPIRNEVGA
jgi:hypothetical protein